MKKLLLCFIVLCFVGNSSISYAHIKRKVDSFDNSIRFVSYNDIDIINHIGLKKIYFSDGGIKYNIFLSSNASDKDDMYSKKDVEIKTDADISKVKVVDATITRFIYSADIIDSKVELSPELVEKIKNANKISVRFYKENGMANTINLSDKVVAEWKQVINTEK